jgi:hypothetical protein
MVLDEGGRFDVETTVTLTDRATGATMDVRLSLDGDEL